jgi:hypothetical protein
MTDEEKLQRVTKLHQLIEKAKDVFAQIGATDIQMLGALRDKRSDFLSDGDLWISFSDERINEIREKRFDYFQQIGTILLFHESIRNNPINGNYTLLLFDTPSGPIQIDIYLSPQSNLEKLLFYLNTEKVAPFSISEGLFERDALKEENESERIDFLICMGFIAIKMIKRQKSADFMALLLNTYTKTNKDAKLELPDVVGESDEEKLLSLLQLLSQKSSTTQKQAIMKIINFAQTVGGIIAP